MLLIDTRTAIIPVPGTHAETIQAAVIRRKTQDPNVTPANLFSSPSNNLRFDLSPEARSFDEMRKAQPAYLVCDTALMVVCHPLRRVMIALEDMIERDIIDKEEDLSKVITSGRFFELSRPAYSRAQSDLMAGAASSGKVDLTVVPHDEVMTYWDRITKLLQIPVATMMNSEGMPEPELPTALIDDRARRVIHDVYRMDFELWPQYEMS